MLTSPSAVHFFLVSFVFVLYTFLALYNHFNGFQERVEDKYKCSLCQANLEHLLLLHVGIFKGSDACFLFCSSSKIFLNLYFELQIYIFKCLLGTYVKSNSLSFLKIYFFLQLGVLIFTVTHTENFTVISYSSFFPNCSRSSKILALANELKSACISSLIFHCLP